jgi:hypothetical protein
VAVTAFFATQTAFLAVALGLAIVLIPAVGAFGFG